MSESSPASSFDVLQQCEPITRQRRLHAGAGSAKPAGQPQQVAAAQELDQLLRQGHAAAIERIEQEVRVAALKRAEAECAEKAARLEDEAKRRWEKERKALVDEAEGIRQRMLSALETIEAQRKELLEQSESFAVKVAYAAVTRIVGALADEGKLVGALVAKAMADNRLGGPFHIRVAKEDYERFVSLSTEELPAELLPDDKLKPGACLVELEHGSIDAGLDAQLTAFKDALLRSLPDGRNKAS